MEKQTISVQELASQLGISVPKAYELTKTTTRCKSIQAYGTSQE